MVKSSKHKVINEILGFILLVTIIIVMEVNISLQQHCPSLLSSQTGFALVGKEYKSFTTKDYAACMFACDSDERCMSVNYNLDTKTCELNTQTKESQPTRYQERPNSIYTTNMAFRTPVREKKGSKEFPAKSCLDILVSGDSVGTGAYWIDPANTGSPLEAFCDMTTDGGGWTVVTRTMLQSTNLPNKHVYGTYQVIAKYKKNDRYVIPYSRAMLDIHQKMGFHQIHFYCHKKSVGRIVSIMTRNNTAGQQVVRYFTDDAFASTTLPDACSSFDVLPEDTSVIARNCGRWGKDADQNILINKWGFKGYEGKGRIASRPFAMDGAANHAFGCVSKMEALIRCNCDDNFDKEDPYTVGDTWQISVR